MDQAAEPVPPQDPDIRAMGSAPIVEIIAEYDPFHAKAEWGDLRSELGSRVTTTVIENASHDLFPEQPDAVASAVLGCLPAR